MNNIAIDLEDAQKISEASITLKDKVGIPDFYYSTVVFFNDYNVPSIHVYLQKDMFYLKEQFPEIHDGYPVFVHSSEDFGPLKI